MYKQSYGSILHNKSFFLNESHYNNNNLNNLNIKKCERVYVLVKNHPLY